MLEQVLIQYLPLLILLVVTFFTGRIIERRHYKSILKWEEEFSRLRHTSIGRRVNGGAGVTESRLVCGEAVVSVEFFRWFVGLLHSMFGGAMREYESSLDRARREAILRMKQSAAGASAIVNVRIEHTPISYGMSRFSGVEAIAWGTAVYKDTEI
ncbi:YbjQ family protein [Salidesulfovibrio brasiliensis]|uniref:YbjQ family protein n=1 Tax=Salidesulfovibrio brasiliensis TaxID=221711 RepID=UPI0006D157F8|nr:heavy metal-binding domain-containing protein [Salidesulfovibrio brasiliensis]